MEKEPLVLVFDCGTQSTRAFLFNKKGENICMSKINTVPYYSDKVGFAEKPTEEYWNVIVQASQELKSKCGELWNDVVAMAVTSIRGTYASLDKNNNPLRPAITWLDQRLGNENQHFSLFHRIIYKLGGMERVALKQRRMSPSTWIKENQPEIWEKTSKFVMVSAYINFRLCGRLVDCTASQASRLPYNYKKHRWMRKSELNYTVFNCEREKMCELIEPGKVMGYLTKEAALEMGVKEGMTIISTGSDKACETLGVGCLETDIASLSYGTTATVQIMSPKYVEPQKFMPAYNAVVPNYYNPEIQVFRGYWMVSWFKDQFSDSEKSQAMQLGISAEDILNETLLNVPAGCDGLILQPYWAPGLKTPEAKGTIIGFNDCHTKAHLYRSIIEGIGYALFDGITNLQSRSGQKINRISLSGGGSQSDAICQITADMFGMPVYRVQTYETSGLGAAMVAFTAIGEFKDIYHAVKEMVHFKDEFLPDKKNHEIYMQIFTRVYRGLYKQVQPLYNELYNIVNNKG